MVTGRMTKDELKKVLDDHRRWLDGDEGGRRADLHGANLHGADLSGANLSWAYLSWAKIDEMVAARLSILPDEGDVVGWKRAVAGDGSRRIVKLLVRSGTPRSNATGRKCRCERATVLDVQDACGRSVGGVAHSMHDRDFAYEVGQEVSVPDFDPDRWNECSAGIHFFITRAEALAY